MTESPHFLSSVCILYNRSKFKIRAAVADSVAMSFSNPIQFFQDYSKKTDHLLSVPTEH